MAVLLRLWLPMIVVLLSKMNSLSCRNLSAGMKRMCHPASCKTLAAPMLNSGIADGEDGAAVKAIHGCFCQQL